MSGQWPPEWEDPDTGLPDEWTLDDAGLDPEASGVTAFLASMPSPVLPTTFEARISAAIAAEATARATGPGSAGTELADAGMATAGTKDAETTGRSSPLELSPRTAESGSATSAKRRRRHSTASGRSARRSGPANSRPDGRRRGLRLPSAAVMAPLLVVLVLGGFGYLFTQIDGSSSSSSSAAAGSAAGPVSASGSVAEPAAGLAPSRSAPHSNILRDGGSAQFVITESGTKYRGSTLASQVRAQLNAQNEVTPAASAPGGVTPGTEASASAPAPAATPPTLTGCVSRLTDGAAPSLVDRASYDGVPAYIIALPKQAWVVGLDCTAADLHEITSVSLKGLSGNLSALGSVEGYASPGERHMQ